jgi:hypothetical protein
VIGRPYGTGQESEDLIEEDEEVMETAESPMPVYALTLAEERVDMDEMADIEMKTDFVYQAEAAPRPVVRRIRKSIPFAKKKKTFGPSELSQVVGKWNSEELLFAVREPFPSKTTGTNLVFGKIGANEALRIESLMGENGVIFSDGIESDFISFNSGAEAVITLADRKGRIVV